MRRELLALSADEHRWKNRAHEADRALFHLHGVLEGIFGPLTTERYEPVTAAAIAEAIRKRLAQFGAMAK